MYDHNPFHKTPRLVVNNFHTALHHSAGVPVAQISAPLKTNGRGFDVKIFIVEITRK